MNKNFHKLYKLLSEDKPEVSDAMIWLQGDRYDRAKNILRAYKLGLSKIIVICGNDKLIGSDTRIGEKNISLNEMKQYLIQKGVVDKDIITVNKAYNTRDQAKLVIGLANKKRWAKIILVSSAYNQPRAFLTFLYQSKKSAVNIRIFNYPLLMNLDKVPGGRNDTVAELFSIEIEKIKKYNDDLLPISFGIDYIIKKKL